MTHTAQLEPSYQTKRMQNETPSPIEEAREEEEEVLSRSSLEEEEGRERRAREFKGVRR